MIYNLILDFRASYSSRKAFTLAETLITIGLIGILAAILIPAVTSISPNRNKVMLRKAYTTLEQTIAKMANDDINYPADQVTTMGGYVYPRVFNNTTQTTNTSNKFCYFFADNLTTIGNITCPVITFGYKQATTVLANTTDGISWFFGGTSLGSEAANFPVDTTKYYTFIIADVNGVANAPNCLDDTGCIATNRPVYNSTPYTCGCAKPDTFVFGIRFDGKIRLGFGGGTDTYLNNVLQSPTDNQ